MGFVFMGGQESNPNPLIWMWVWGVLCRRIVVENVEETDFFGIESIIRILVLNSEFDFLCDIDFEKLVDRVVYGNP